MKCKSMHNSRLIRIENFYSNCGSKTGLPLLKSLEVSRGDCHRKSSRTEQGGKEFGLSVGALPTCGARIIDITMSAKEFFENVKKMRAYQKEYFRFRNKLSLEMSKQYERIVDKEIERVEDIQKERREPKLF